VAGLVIKAFSLFPTFPLRALDGEEQQGQASV
jgi:hypothetical protein